MYDSSTDALSKRAIGIKHYFSLNWIFIYGMIYEIIYIYIWIYVVCTHTRAHTHAHTTYPHTTHYIHHTHTYIRMTWSSGLSTNCKETIFCVNISTRLKRCLLNYYKCRHYYVSILFSNVMMFLTIIHYISGSFRPSE